MEELLEILEELHPEIDFEEHDRLMDDKVLDSFGYYYTNSRNK